MQRSKVALPAPSGPDSAITLHSETQVVERAHAGDVHSSGCEPEQHPESAQVGFGANTPHKAV